jgi:hypothetical protein
VCVCVFVCVCGAPLCVRVRRERSTVVCMCVCGSQRSTVLRARVCVCARSGAEHCVVCVCVLCVCVLCVCLCGAERSIVLRVSMCVRSAAKHGVVCVRSTLDVLSLSLSVCVCMCAERSGAPCFARRALVCVRGAESRVACVCVTCVAERSTQCRGVCTHDMISKLLPDSSGCQGELISELWQHTGHSSLTKGPVRFSCGH